MPVPKLAEFDAVMQDYMADNDINAAVLGIMKDHQIIYLRGFGYKDQDLSVNLPENAMMRIASVTKPFTAAAIRKLIDWGGIELGQRVFTLDLSAGILNYTPWDDGEEIDDRLERITVDHLLRHRGGWDRDIRPIRDLSKETIQIALDMEFSPYRVPDRVEIVQWIMSHDLEFDPGLRYAYSNEGYLILGLILEQESGKDLHTFWRDHVLDSSTLWFPTSEFENGYSFAKDQNPREPWYNWTGTGKNVFAPDNYVPLPYGGWDHQSRVAQGGMIASAVPLLHLADNYVLDGTSIGIPLTTPIYEDKPGGLAGTEALARQRGDGINYAILINKIGPNPYYASELKTLIDVEISNTSTWPTQAVDGIWVDFTYDHSEQGCYNEPFDSIDDLTDPNKVKPYSKARIKSGSTTWTGTINQEIILSAPEGPVVIGQ